MAQSVNPHDRFFKEAFSREDVAASFLRHHLPADLAGLIQPDSLEIRKDSFVDPELAEHHSDLLYAVRWLNGEPGYVHVLFEHKSYPERRIALDLMRYITRIAEQTLKAGHAGLLPAILPVVVYHGRQPWNIPLDSRALFDAPAALDPFIPAFRYVLTDLTTYSDEELQGDALLRVALLVLKYIFSPQLGERLPGILTLLANLAEQRSGLDYLYTVLRYVASGAPHLSRTVLSESVQRIFTRGNEIMSTIAEEWVREGLSEGRREEAAALVKRLLASRFGDLPEWVDARLQTASLARLEDYAVRVLDAANLEAVLAD